MAHARPCKDGLDWQDTSGHVEHAIWRIERQIGEKSRARWVASSDALQPAEVADAHNGVRVAPLQMRLIPPPDEIELRRPIGALTVQSQHQLDEVAPGGSSLGGR